MGRRNLNRLRYVRPHSDTIWDSGEAQEATNIRQSLSQQVVLRAAIMGGVAGACGYLGPIYLDPGAALGPLFGIFFSGPLGVLLGACLGLLFQRLTLKVWLREGLFFVATLLLAAGVLLAVRPGDKPLGVLVDAEVVECGTGEERWEAAAKRWSETALKNPRIRQRPNWIADLARLRRDDPGVVLSVRIWRAREMYFSKKHSGGGQWKAGPWNSAKYDGAYFARYAGNRCSEYPTGSRGMYWVHVEDEKEFPPVNSPGFLSLFVMDRLPGELEPFSH